MHVRILSMIVAVVMLAVAGLAQPATQYLVPVVPVGTPGAFGSIWRGELSMYNDAATPVNVEGPYCNPNVLSCNNTLIALEHGWSAAPLLYSQTPSSDGAFLYVSTPAPGLVFNFRIRDVSRDAQNWGTELPIVPTSRFKDHVQLINVPTDDRFRLMLRVYSTDAAAARISVVAFPGDTLMSVQEVSLVVPATAGDERNFIPAYAQIPLSTGGPSATVRVQVEQIRAGGTPIWAFVSVTNNETQHVTAITPQP